MEKVDKNRSLVLSLLTLSLGMLFLSFAAVPIYNIFCKVTGFAGTTMRDTKGSGYQYKKGSRQITVAFDANTHPSLPWRFVPKQKKVKVVPGENVMVFYEAENLSDKDIIGTSVYNVIPNKAGVYFVKIQCFCFEEQLLKAGEKMLMPVSFYIDPEFESDPLVDEVDSITLSYTFFKIREADK